MSYECAKPGTTPSTVSQDQDAESITLSRAELAFLQAVIEDLQEESSGRIESMTVLADPAVVAAKWTKVLKKVTKKVTKATKYTWLVTEFVGGVVAETPPQLAEQRAQLAKLKEQLITLNSLEDLVELRAKFDGTATKDKC
jgi:hypothetical protein